MVRAVDKEAYFQQIGYTPHSAGQWSFHRSKARFRTPVCGRRYGKALSISTTLATPDGWQTMASIAVDDYVYGPSGEPNRVVAKSEVLTNEVCYEVVFDDDSVLIAHDQHQWAVETYTMRKSRSNGRWNVKPYKIMTTHDLAARVGKVKYPDTIMLSQPVQMSVQKQTVDSYLYGLWLGDGTTATGDIAAESLDAHNYATYYEAVGYDFYPSNSNKYVYKSAGLRKGLRDLGVLGNKSNIPDEYRFGSVDQRLALLQGLMDSDGTVSVQQLQFDNSNKDLIDLVEWLVVSLGGKCTVRSREPYYKNEADEKIWCETSYRVSFNVAFPAFRLQRKLDKQMQLNQGPQTFRRYIKKVRHVASVPMQCIQVEGQDGLYLAGRDLIVTHNSTMAATDMEPHLFVPKTRGWIVGPTYDLGEKEFRVMWNHLIIGQKLGRDKRVKKAYSKRTGEMYIEMPWQSRVEVRSADRPDTLVGEALNWVIMSEAAKHKKETFERFIQPALSDFHGEATFPTTPEGFNWLHDLWRLGLDPTFPEFESWRLPSWENPVVFPEGRTDPEILLQERTTDPVWFMQEYGADFAAFVGKIFVEWDETVHVEPWKYNPALENYMAFDWGYTNPLAAIEFQIDSWDRVRVWREHYLSKTTLEQHIRLLKGRDDPPGYRGVQLAFGDAADPEACAFVSQHFAPCVGDPMAKSNWRQGIDLMNRLLKQQEVGEADEYGTPLSKPWMTVDNSCHNLIREFNNYRAKEPIRGQNVPEMGQKIDDHAIDALRYGLMHCFELGARSHLSEIYNENMFKNSPDTGYFTTGDLSF